MKWLNYHHLFYFWVVAREGSIVRAATELRLSEPTVGAQIHALERSLGEKLFTREGRTLVLTEAGRVAQDYATEIFRLGREFQSVVGVVGANKSVRLTVGIADVIPRLFAFRVLEPAFRKGRQPITVDCQSDSPDRLFARLLANEVDLVISDAPLRATTKVPIDNRLLGDSGITIFGAAELAARCRRGFPSSLEGEPFLMPAATSAGRRSLEHWFASVGVRPNVRGEFTDSSLLKIFAGAGIGAFAAPTVLSKEIAREHRVRVIGRVDEVRERYYLTSAGRRTEHPCVATIMGAVRSRLFG